MEEFTAETVKLMKQSDRSLSSIAMELEINTKSIGKWVRRSDEAGIPIQEDERAELRRLRRENQELRMEKEILRKATAFFATECRRGSRSSMWRRHRIRCAINSSTIAARGRDHGYQIRRLPLGFGGRQMLSEARMAREFPVLSRGCRCNARRPECFETQQGFPSLLLELGFDLVLEISGIRCRDTAGIETLRCL